MKKNILLQALLLVLPFSLFSTNADSKQEAPIEQVQEKPKLTIEDLEKMSDEQIAALLAQDDIDIDDVRMLLGDPLAERARKEEERANKQSTQVPAQTRMPSFLQPNQLPAKELTFEEMVADQQKKYPIPTETLEQHAVEYSGPEAAAVPEPKEAILELGERYTNFLDKHVRGKKIEVMITVGYVLYRQAIWIFNTYLIEKAQHRAGGPDYAKMNSLQTNSLIGDIFCVTGMDSRLAEFGDTMIRLAFCGTRLWMDLSNWYRVFKQPQLWMHDPDTFFHQFLYNWRRAYYFFSDPLFYGSQISYLKKVMLGLALPFAWCSLFSKNSPGNPMRNPLFQRAMSRTVHTSAVEAGMKGEQWFNKTFNEKKQKTLFQKSGGIIRERLFTDMALWMYKYIHHRHIYPEKGKAHKGIAPYMARQAGKYAIRHVYLQGLIGVLKTVFRNGGLKAIGWVTNKIGWVFGKMGFFRRNPISQLGDGVKRSCVRFGLLNEKQDVEEVLVYAAVAYPGAFTKAVQQVVNKQSVPLIEKREPRFTEFLNNMNELSPYELMRRFPYNPLIMTNMWESVSGVKNALTPLVWRKVLSSFMNELIIDVFLNRERLVCQFITESILTWASKPLLKKINHGLLPES